MLLAATESTPIYIATAVFGAAAFFGVIVGQFRRGVVSELRASLGTAQVELGIHKEIVERLQKTLDSLDARIKTLEKENGDLRATLEVGTALIPFVRDEFIAFEARVVARHRLLAATLPEPAKSALASALSTDNPPGGHP